MSANGRHLFGKRVERILRAMAAVAHAAEVQRDHRERTAEERRDPVPPMGVGITAVDKAKAWFSGPTPAQVMDAAAVHADESVLRRPGTSLREPRGRSLFLRCHHVLSVETGQRACRWTAI